MSVPRSIGDYSLVKVLGRGSFSTVVLAQHAITRRTVAIKVISKSSVAASAGDKRSLETELSILKKANHPLIVSLFDVLEDGSNYYLVMEYLDKGSLLQFVNSHGPMSERHASEILGQLVCALDYLHNVLNVAHRDIKAENILLDANMNIRVIDFGLSKTNIAPHALLLTRCGSCAYAAPEVLTGRPYTAQADIWSLGVVIYAIMIGHVPFKGETEQKTVEQIVKAEPTFPSYVSDEWADLIRRMLTKDPQARITIAELKEHRLVREFEFADVANVDAGVMEFVTSNGFSRDAVLADLEHGTFTRGAACYRIMKRERMNREMGKTSIPCSLPRLRRTPGANSASPKVFVKSLALARNNPNVRSVPPQFYPPKGILNQSPLVPMIKVRRRISDTGVQPTEVPLASLLTQ